MIAELGHLLAFLALATAAAQSVLGLTTGGEAPRRLAVATGMFLLLSMLTLIISFVRLDFSVANWSPENSHSSEADHLPHCRGVGEPRRLDAAVVCDHGGLWRSRCAVDA